MRWRAFYPGVPLAVFLAMPLSAAGQGSVDLITVQGAIDPIVARFATRASASATDHHADAVIIRMDTPGGLDVSMRQIAQAIIGSRVPVIVYVAPPGARAGSAGVFITVAAHVAAMAPGTNIGAAHPVSIGGAQISSMPSSIPTLRISCSSWASGRSLLSSPIPARFCRASPASSVSSWPLLPLGAWRSTGRAFRSSSLG